MVNNLNDQGESYKLFGLQDGYISPLGLPRGLRAALKDSNEITSNYQTDNVGRRLAKIYGAME